MRQGPMIARNRRMKKQQAYDFGPQKLNPDYNNIHSKEYYEELKKDKEKKKNFIQRFFYRLISKK